MTWNHRLLPIIDARLERAESQVRAFLLTQDGGAVRVGADQVELDKAEDIQVERLNTSDWQQLRIAE